MVKQLVFVAVRGLSGRREHANRTSGSGRWDHVSAILCMLARPRACASEVKFIERNAVDIVDLECIFDTVRCKCGRDMLDCSDT